jgi:hypothetical protein
MILQEVHPTLSLSEVFYIKGKDNLVFRRMIHREIPDLDILSYKCSQDTVNE